MLPMARLLIIAHAPLASAFQAVARHAYPDLAVSAVQALDVEPGMGADEVEALARRMLAAADEAAARRAAAPYVELAMSGDAPRYGDSPVNALAVEDTSDHTLVLTDVFGATPANAAQRLADGVRVRMLCGINVPMLWRALNYIGLPLNELVERSMSGAAQGVVSINSTRPQNQALLPHAHDAQHNHHQQ
jgi:PTS system ascorbate-specific IIA component